MVDGVYQVRKVFDPRSMSMREEIVQTGTVKSAPEPEADTPTKDSTPKAKAAKTSIATKAKAAKTSIATKAKAAVRKKKSDA